MPHFICRGLKWNLLAAPGDCERGDRPPDRRGERRQRHIPGVSYGLGEYVHQPLCVSVAAHGRWPSIDNRFGGGE